ncbi:MAG: FtsX-like permease family protein, partial [Bacteroidota bacterium]
MKSNSFNIDLAIGQWQNSLLKYQAIDPEFAEELASGLLDRYEALLMEGYPPEEAFNKAKKRTLKDPSLLADEISRVKGTGNGLVSDLRFMLPNYLKTGWRNLSRKGFYNSINLVSLTIGVVCAMLAILYIDYETSFDGFIPESNRIYRIGQSLRSQEYSMIAFEDYNGASDKKQLIHINAIKNTQGVMNACHFFIFDQPRVVLREEEKLPTTNILQTNTPRAFLDIFSWPIIEGSKKQFIQNPNTVLLTESEAARFYGDDWKWNEIAGNVIKQDTVTYTIAGVLKDVPSNSHLDFSMAIHQNKIDYWGARTYIKVEENIDGSTVNTNLNDNIGKINTRLARSELFGGYILDGLDKIHLNSNKLYEMKQPGDKRYLYIFGIISCIILFLTTSNYTNLSIAMNANRMREIGMRKLFGAGRMGISKQFVLEALLISLLCAPLVIVLLAMVIPQLNDFMGVALAENFLTDLSFWILLFGLLVLVGLLAGLYPALFLSGNRI